MTSSALPPPAPAASPFGFLRRFAVSFKLALIVFLALLLQIPLVMIHALLEERLDRQTEAVEEITRTWGADQTIKGPILVVPYTTTAATEHTAMVEGRLVRTTEQRNVTGFAYFLPERLVLSGELDPSTRQRGIYEAVVYRGKLKFSGNFPALDVRSLGVDPAAFQWNRAWIAIGVSDLRGTQQTIQLAWDGATHTFEPGTRLEGIPTGIHAMLNLSADSVAQPHSFSGEFSLNGSGRMSFVPVGKETEASLKSAWRDPSFTGAYLPAQREVGDGGFSARWLLSYYARNYPQQWTSTDASPSMTLQNMDTSAFGVDLLQVIDSYRVVERSIKYGVLFIVCLFTAFFLFEVLGGLRLHSFHYLLVGAALCLFYLALLSASEFLSFSTAYSVAAIASTALIAGYCKSVLHSGGRALAITGALVVVYGLLYLILQLQDYALLCGTIAMFVVLGFVMYATRRVDWTRQFANE